MAKRKQQSNIDSIFHLASVLNDLYNNPDLKAEVEERLKQNKKQPGKAKHLGNKKNPISINDFAYDAWVLQQQHKNPAFFGDPENTSFPFIAQKPCWN